MTVQKITDGINTLKNKNDYEISNIQLCEAQIISVIKIISYMGLKGGQEYQVQKVEGTLRGSNGMNPTKISSHFQVSYRQTG